MLSSKLWKARTQDLQGVSHSLGDTIQDSSTPISSPSKIGRFKSVSAAEARDGLTSPYQSLGEPHAALALSAHGVAALDGRARPHLHPIMPGLRDPKCHAELGNSVRRRARVPLGRSRREPARIGRHPPRAGCAPPCSAIRRCLSKSPAFSCHRSVWAAARRVIVRGSKRLPGAIPLRAMPPVDWDRFADHSPPRHPRP